MTVSLLTLCSRITGRTSLNILNWGVKVRNCREHCIRIVYAKSCTILTDCGARQRTSKQSRKTPIIIHSFTSERPTSSGKSPCTLILHLSTTYEFNHCLLRFAEPRLCHRHAHPVLHINICLTLHANNIWTAIPVDLP